MTHTTMPPVWQPEGWPWVGKGIIAGAVGPMMVHCYDTDVADDDSFSRYLVELRRSFVERPKDVRVVSLTHIHTKFRAKNQHTNKIREEIGRHRATITATTMANAQCANSVLSRTILSLVFSIAKMPCPTKVSSNISESTDFLCRYIDGANPKELAAAYRAFLQQHAAAAGLTPFGF